MKIFVIIHKNSQQSSPNIFESTGSAEVRIKSSKLFAIRWISEVFLLFGKILEKIGIV
jgi:hypothetical protein